MRCRAFIPADSVGRFVASIFFLLRLGRQEPSSFNYILLDCISLMIIVFNCSLPMCRNALIALCDVVEKSVRPRILLNEWLVFELSELLHR